MKKRFFVILLALYSATALSQSTFYHCTKNGRKVISDQPCEELGAKETKRVAARDMPPLNTAKGMSEEERRQTIQHWQNQKAADDRISQAMESAARSEEQEKEQRCKDLWEQKESIKSQQRQRNSQWLNDRHRVIDDRIFKLKCGM